MFRIKPFARYLLKLYYKKILKVLKEHEGNVEHVEYYRARQKLGARVYLKDDRIIPVEVSYKIDKDKLF